MSVQDNRRSQATSRVAARLAAVTFVVAALGWGSSQAAPPPPVAQPVPIRISWQPAVPWAIPMYEATKQGWWEQVGLKVVSTTHFPAGAPQVAAAASGSWDLGATGSVPAIEGAREFGLLTIGISDEEGGLNQMMASKSMADQIAKDPQVLKGQAIPVTQQSTGQWAVLACLQNKFKVSPKDVKLLNMQLAAINTGARSGSFQVWMEYTQDQFELEHSIGAKVICDGRQAGIHILGNIVVTPGFAKAHPEAVAAFLAVYSHGVVWSRKHPDEAVRAFADFAKQGGKDLTLAQAKTMLELAPNFTVPEQLKLMGVNGEPNQWHEWLDELIKFGTTAGMFHSPPSPNQFATSKYMQMVEKNPALLKFATESN